MGVRLRILTESVTNGIESVLLFRLGEQLGKVGPSAHLQPVRDGLQGEWEARGQS